MSLVGSIASQQWHVEGYCVLIGKAECAIAQVAKSKNKRETVMKIGSCRAAAIACSMALVAPFAGAVTLDILPTTQTVTLGDTVSVTIDVSGLAAGGPDSLGSFDFSFAYDSAILATDQDNNIDTEADTDVVFGSGLNLFPSRDPAFGNQFAEFISGPAACAAPSMCINFVEFSEEEVEPDSTFFTDQPMAFTLITISFDTIALGSTDLTFLADLELADENGDLLTVDGTNNASITVVAAASPVPVPASLLLLVGGLIGLRHKPRRSAVEAKSL